MLFKSYKAFSLRPGFSRGAMEVDSITMDTLVEFSPQKLVQWWRDSEEVLARRRRVWLSSRPRRGNERWPPVRSAPGPSGSASSSTRVLRSQRRYRCSYSGAVLGTLVEGILGAEVSVFLVLFVQCRNLQHLHPSPLSTFFPCVVGVFVVVRQ